MHGVCASHSAYITVTLSSVIVPTNPNESVIQVFAVLESRHCVGGRVPPSPMIHSVVVDQMEAFR